jgi:multiple sugar transport system permease protein
MVTASLHQPGLPPPRTIEWIPNPLAWRNYLDLFKMLPFGRYLLNSLLVVALAIPITLLSASCAGFGMSQLPGHARRRLLALSVGLLMVPATALWLTRFLLVSWLGLFNTYAALVLPALMGSSPLFILLFYWTFRRMPVEIFESARLDGASPLSAWWRLAFPLARPTSLAVTVLTFLLYWNDFINPLLYLNSQQRFTLSLGLRQLQQLDKTNWPLLMAAAVLLTLPAVAVFLALQHRFLQENLFNGKS